MFARVIGFGVILVLVGIVAWRGGGDEGHRLTLYVSEAATMYPGVPVRIAGQDVGAIATAEPTRDGRARLELRIDDSGWPLPSDTRFALRFGGTVSSSNRYVELAPGQAATMLRDHAVIASSRVRLPLEVDELARTLSAPVRRDLRTLLHRGGTALMAAKPPLRRTLSDAPAAISQARAVAEALGSDTRALDTLVRAGDRVTAAIDAADPTLGDLVQDADSAFAAVAGESAALRDTLEHTPALLTSARATLARADRTLLTTRDLSRRLRPAVEEVDRIARPLGELLVRCGRRGPTRPVRLRRCAVRQRTSTRCSGACAVCRRRHARSSTSSPTSCSASGRTRLSWPGSSVRGRLPRARATARTSTGASPCRAYPFHTGIPLNTPQVQKLYPPVVTEYAFPRPPGRNAGQPWFLPECGVGPESAAYGGFALAFKRGGGDSVRLHQKRILVLHHRRHLRRRAGRPLPRRLALRRVPHGDRHPPVGPAGAARSRPRVRRAGSLRSALTPAPGGRARVALPVHDEGGRQPVVGGRVAAVVVWAARAAATERWAGSCSRRALTWSPTVHPRPGRPRDVDDPRDHVGAGTPAGAGARNVAGLAGGGGGGAVVAPEQPVKLHPAKRSCGAADKTRRSSRRLP